MTNFRVAGRLHPPTLEMTQLGGRHTRASIGIIQNRWPPIPQAWGRA